MPPAPLAKIKLPRRVTSLGSVAEEFRSAYEADGDEFVLGDLEIDDPKGLKNALDEERRLFEEYARKVAKERLFDKRKDASATLLGDHIDNVTKMVRNEEGEWVAQVWENGRQRLGKTAEPMTLDEYLEELSADEEYRGAFGRTRSSGNDGHGDNANGDGEYGRGVNTTRRTLPSDFDLRNATQYSRLQELANKDNVRYVDEAGRVVIEPIAGSGDGGPGGDSMERTRSGDINAQDIGGVGGSTMKRKLPSDFNPRDTKQYSRLQELANKNNVTYVDEAGLVAIEPVA